MANWRGREGVGNDENWRSALLRLVGARQGGGEAVAVDVRRLKAPLEALLNRWSIPPPPKGLEQFVSPAPGVVPPPDPDFKLKKFDLAKTLAEEAERLATWAGRVEEALGKDATPETLAATCDAVYETASACQGAGHATPRDADPLRALNDLIGSARAPELLRNARELALATDTGARLRLRARHDAKAEIILTRWLECASALFGLAEGKLPPAPSGAAPDPAALAREELAKAVDGLGDVFEKGAHP